MRRFFLNARSEKGSFVVKKSFLLAALVCALPPSMAAQSAAPRITKIDPPNWWAGMSKAMLLVKGENLEGARFRLSDAHLRVERVKISSNGHWAELWLNASPSRQESVTISAKSSAGEASLPFRFEQRRAESEGFRGFSSKDVMYLIMTDRFARGGPQAAEATGERDKPRGWHGGNLEGVVEHLDYLQSLGITTVWVTPVYQNHEPQSYHGYGATDLYAVDEHYGSLADLKTLSEALHKRGMKLVLDLVPNHVGPEHPWVEDEPEPDWFHGTKAQHHAAQGEFKPLTDPHAPWRDQRDVLDGWFANVLPDMNPENPAVAQYLTQNAVWWTEEAGADGLRLDTFPYVGRAFWQGFHTTLHTLYPQLTTVGEVFNQDATITSSFAGGVTRNGVDTGLDTPFDFPTFFALRDVFAKGAPMTRLTDVWRQDALYPHPERLVPFLGNHDNRRFLSEPGADSDQMRLAFLVLLTMRGMPEIYSGDEIAMTGGEDPDNRHDFPGGFAGDAQSAFSKRTPEQSAIYDWVHGLLTIRSQIPALTTGAMQVLHAEKDVLVFARYTQGQCVMTALNRAGAPAAVEVPAEETIVSGKHSASLLLGTGTASFHGQNLHLDLPAKSGALLEIR